MSIKMAKSGKAMEYFTIKIEGGFSIESLGYLILGWENDYKKILKIKSYSKLMSLAKKQLLDKGYMWLECPCENLEYDVDSVENIHKKVMQHIKDVEPTKYLGKTTEEIKQLQVDRKMLEEIKQIQSEVA